MSYRLARVTSQDWGVRDWEGEKQREMGGQSEKEGGCGGSGCGGSGCGGGEGRGEEGGGKGGGRRN